MKFCSFCRKENKDTAQFCGYCGKPFSCANIDTDLAYQKNDLKLRKEQLKLQKEQLELEKQAQKSMAKCPKCKSTSLTANKKGFGVGKAVIGATILGPIGLAAGGINAKKVWVTCMNCGKRFKV